MTNKHDDIDAIETKEWLDALESVLSADGPERAHFLLQTLIERTRQSGVDLPYHATTAYENTIPVDQQPKVPGDLALEWRIRCFIRWNAMAMVANANRDDEGLGGHIASFASAATLYEVGFNHFFHAPNENHGGDMVFIQGHSSPGIYARAFLEGRLTEADLRRFRREAKPGGLSSYPHPWLMPGFWQFPTVSMGLGPLMAIYQARFMRYMHNRGKIDATPRHVWAYMGDGEMDEPESLGAISLASREKLDNLIFVINCNLQRLDGPVRGNGKIIQELEAVFHGAGWNVIKVVWGSKWDALLAADHKGLLRKRMEECVDGEYQAIKASMSGAYVREHFFGKYPELKQMVAHLTDEEILGLNRGGHDPHKVFAAYAAAAAHEGQPTVILAKTIKGYGMGDAGEAQNPSHQQKKMSESALKAFRDRFDIPVSDEQLKSTPFYRPAADSPEMKYLHARREALGGYLPARQLKAEALKIPALETFNSLLSGSGPRDISTTMAFVRFINILLRDPNIKDNVVPIVPDEARTFGMEGMFRQLGIYAPFGQKYTPVDDGHIAPYKELPNGQILEEGINEAGAMSSWIAAGTSYANHGVQMMPFYIYYSMFGFQRIGDLAWAAGDMQVRGFLIGGTSGRTTLNGEGLQHQDGHSHLMANTIPNCVSYDPTFAYELAVIMQEGMRRMFAEQENIYFYITTMNENYAHPEMPKGAEEGIRKGLYLLQKAEDKALKVNLVGSGSILRESIAAAEILERDYGVAANVWSATSFNELARNGQAVDRWNRLHPEAEPRVAYVTEMFGAVSGPVIAATDYVKLFADQIRAWVPQRYLVLGTDGFGRSDTRSSLRAFFEVDRNHIVVAALTALRSEGLVDAQTVRKAIETLGIDPESANPLTV